MQRTGAGVGVGGVDMLIVTFSKILIKNYVVQKIVLFPYWLGQCSYFNIKQTKAVTKYIITKYINYIYSSIPNQYNYKYIK